MTRAVEAPPAVEQAYLASHPDFPGAIGLVHVRRGRPAGSDSALVVRGPGS